MADARQPCLLFVSCIGAAPKYFMQLSDDFRHRYRVTPYLFNDVSRLPEMLDIIEPQLPDTPLLIYHEPDWMPYLGEYLDRYEEFLERIPSGIIKISIPQPGFTALWPFHCGDPRNADAERRRNRYGMLPFYAYGDTYVLRRLEEGVPPDEVVASYLAADLAAEVDLDNLLAGTLSMIERQDRSGTVKVADYIAGNFRSKMLFQTINHANNRLNLYMANKVLRLLECRTVPETVLDTVSEIIERPMPVHPGVARHFGMSYIDADTRYPVDEINNLTFAEFIRAYAYCADGGINYADALLNNPMVPLPAPAG